MPRGRGGRHRTRPFASKKQMRYFFVNPKLRRYARKKAHATGMHSAITRRKGYSPAYRHLPLRKGRRKR